MSKTPILESLTEPEKIWKLNKFPFKIGRKEDNDLVIDCTIPENGRPIKSYVSRYHVEINLVENGYSIRDLRSRNGTYVNGFMIKEEIPLKTGDILGIGTCYEMEFKILDSEVPLDDKTEPLTLSKTVPIESTD